MPPAEPFCASIGFSDDAVEFVLPPLSIPHRSPSVLGWVCGRLDRTIDRRSTVKQLPFSFLSVFGHLFFVLQTSSGI